jgi:hypothetical protein
MDFRFSQLSFYVGLLTRTDESRMENYVLGFQPFVEGSDTDAIIASHLSFGFCNTVHGKKSFIRFVEDINRILKQQNLYQKLEAQGAAGKLTPVRRLTDLPPYVSPRPALRACPLKGAFHYCI